jgi:subtilisin family serine protease
VDDVSGWDFVEGDAIPQDADGHGTHVAGTAAGSGNDGVGITGVAWRASILPLRVLGDDGTGTVADSIKAYTYAARAGVRIVNLSLGGDYNSRAERDALAAAPNTLFVTAAGNDGADNDRTASFPCNHELPNVLCVAASDRDDALADFSNYGARNVDIAAPGVAIAGPWPDGGWVLLDGTSMATPMVSGAAALLLAREPGATVAGLRRSLLDGADPRSSLSGRVVTGARLNAAGALDQITGNATLRDDATTGTPESGGGQTATQPPQQPPAQTQQPSQPAPAPSPQPAPAPAQPAAPLADRSAPLVRLSTKRLKGRRLRITVRCNERCSLRIQLRRGTRTIRTTTKRTAGSVTLRIPKRHRRAKLTARVTATDAASNRRTATRRVR